MVETAQLRAKRAERAARSRDRNWTAAAIGLSALAALQFGSTVILWFWPYQIAGLLNETGLLALSVALAFIADRLAVRPGGVPPWRFTISLAAGLYAIASMAGLGWSAETGVGLGVQRYAVFSTPACEFAARFQSPPQLGRFHDAKFEAERAIPNGDANLAILADIRSFNSYRAECQTTQPGNAAANGALVEQAALRWAEEIGVKISGQSSASDQRGAMFQLEGEVGGSILPETPGQKSRTLIALRSYLGQHSVMTVYVFQPVGAELSQQSRDFLDGVRRR